MLTPLSTVKSRLALTVTDYDDLLTSAIKALSDRFDKECNRNLARTTVATHEFDANDTDTHVTYVIERMCLAAGPATTGNCDLLPPKGNPGNTLGEYESQAAKLPFYRVTVRVDGPKNTASFVQAMLR